MDVGFPGFAGGALKLRSSGRQPGLGVTPLVQQVMASFRLFYSGRWPVPNGARRVGAQVLRDALTLARLLAFPGIRKEPVPVIESRR